jgi:predicted DNA-binding transcriptional regulator AlpA
MGISKKLILDSYFLRKIVEKKWPHLDVEDDQLKRLENWSCFSDPDMDCHICNYDAKLKGKVCDFCKSNDELKLTCYRVCEISHVCLSAYANRLKGEFDTDYFENLLTISYDELLLELEALKEGGRATEDVKYVKGQVEEVKEEIQEEPEEIKEEVEEIEEEDEDFVSVKKASEITGVSVPTMYNYIKKGKVEYIKEKSLKISVSSLEKFKK